MRLDKKLVELYPEKTRSQLAKLIEAGAVKVNGEVENRSKYKVREEDVVTVDFPEVKERGDLIAEDLPLDILYECDDYLVINKHKGITVHPGDDDVSQSGTVVNAVMHHCGDSLSGISGEKRPGIVHRLDKDTTGVLIVAKTDMFHAHLAKQIENRETEKIYMALIVGHPQDGEINAPIARSQQDRKKMTVKKGGRDSITRFKVIEYFPYWDVSLLEVDLITGRTHQIRVHLKSIVHPVVGDDLYGFENVNKKFVQKFNISSQILHAYKYSFVDLDGKKQSFEAPLDETFESVLEVLRKEQED